MTEFIIWASSY